MYNTRTAETIFMIFNFFGFISTPNNLIALKIFEESSKKITDLKWCVQFVVTKDHTNNL